MHIAFGVVGLIKTAQRLVTKIFKSRVNYGK